jgi:hypothetical protein
MRHEHPSGAICLLAADVDHRGHTIVCKIAQVAIVLCDPGIEYPNGLVNNGERQLRLTAGVGTSLGPGFDIDRSILRSAWSRAASLWPAPLIRDFQPLSIAGRLTVFTFLGPIPACLRSRLIWVVDERWGETRDGLRARRADTKLYKRTREKLSLDDFERIKI